MGYDEIIKQEGHIFDIFVSIHQTSNLAVDVQIVGRTHRQVAEAIDHLRSPTRESHYTLKIVRLSQ